MLTKLLALLGIFVFSSLLFFALTEINFPATESQKSQVKSTPKEVPELAQILGPDQTTRLKAGRKLVERVGVEKALEILEHSDLPHTGEGHLVVHQIGFHAYKTYKLESILHCKDYFLYACYHGAIIEAATNQGFEAIAKMADHCKASSVRYFQCVHASGHSILAIWDYNLEEALKTCDQLFEKETQFPEALSSCHNGSFMENLFGVHDWGTAGTPKREWLSDDMYFPCNAFGEKYQKGCWLNQAARIYQMYRGDIAQTTRTCEMTGNHQYTLWCIDNLARQIHALTNSDVAKVFELCYQTGPYWQDKCTVVNAGAYYSVGDFKSALNICRQVAQIASPDCYQTVISQIASDPINAKQKKNYCKEIGGQLAKECLSKI